MLIQLCHDVLLANPSESMIKFFLLSLFLTGASVARGQGVEDVTGLPQTHGVSTLARGEVDSLGSLPVAAHDLERGRALGAADMRGGKDAVGRRVGLVALRNVHEGEVLGWGVVGPKTVIEPGALVTCVYSDSGVTVRVTGDALNSAVAGGVVGVRLSGRRRVSGEAQADGTVLLH